MGLLERPLPDLLASNDREATLEFDRTMLQEALQNGGRFLWSDRDKTEKHDAAWCRLASSIDQLPEVTIDGYVCRTPVRHGSDIETCTLERLDRGARNVLIREDADHAAPRSTE